MILNSKRSSSNSQKAKPSLSKSDLNLNNEQHELDLSHGNRVVQEKKSMPISGKGDINLIQKTFSNGGHKEELSSFSKPSKNLEMSTTFHREVKDKIMALEK